MKYILSVLLCFLVLLSGCSKTPELSTSSSPTSSSQISLDDSSSSASSDSQNTNINTEIFSTRDFETEFDETKSAYITLSGNTASSSSNAATINNDKIIISEEGTYVFSGSFSGMIVVNCDKTDKVQIVFNNVDIKSETSAPLYVLQADKVFLTLAENSVNTLSNGGTFLAIDENNIDSVIFSKDDITLNGEGSLKIVSPIGHGIVSKDELTVTSGSYEIESLLHGLSGKDSVAIANASFKITSGKDGIHAENEDDETLGFVHIESGNFVLTSEFDGISAASFINILGGNFNISTGGGSENAEKKVSDMFGGGMMGGGMRPGSFNNQTPNETDTESVKGIKAGADLIISNGTFNLDCVDDAVHSNTNIEISGGSFEIATGDDGFHADDTLTITNGTINISESYEGLEGLHINISGADITLTASDDGLNAAGGTDQSGFGGQFGNDMFGGKGGKGQMGGFGGMMSGSSDGSITISGGMLNITASGDGIDANGTIDITDGYISVCGPTTGDTATLDYDVEGKISGGTFIGTGASGMAQTFSSSSEQGVIAIRVGNVSAGTQFKILNKNGEEIITHSPKLDYAVLIVSSPDIVKGETYTVKIDDITKDFEAS